MANLNPKKVLIVEDDPDITWVVQTYLEQSGYLVDKAEDGLSGLEYALNTPLTLIVLDWMLPQLEGSEFISRLREHKSTPVIMLTAKRQEQDKIMGLELGADDYITKPFSPRELLARIQAVLRRTNLQVTPKLHYNEMLIDLECKTLKIGKVMVTLTGLEFELLSTLAKQPRRIFSRGELLDKVWGNDYIGVDRVVDVHISNLRRKLMQIDPTYAAMLQTAWGIGYKFVEAK